MRSLRHAAAALVGAALVAAAPPPAAPAAPLERLVERYSPILMLKRNDDLPCGKSGEQYLPASVEIMLGNPDVKLVLRRKGRNVLMKLGPTSSDIAGLDENYYLDEPGVPYRPRCTYARESQRLTRGRRPVVYAHLARQPGLPGLALQYWFYYWFNRFNDLHESDWEGIQLAFEASTVEEALARGPTRVAYAQHGGGELADWDDDKLERRGTHPVVYVSSGSHASQYEQALYLGRGRQGSGLGCDDTRPESFAVRPVPILVPTSGAASWLTYRGHWGQYARGYSSGVTGPNRKARWDTPFAWMSGLRTSTPTMPVSQAAGPTVTDFFCGAVSGLATVGDFVGNRGWALGLILTALLLVAAVPVWRTTWNPAPAEPLRQKRAGGQLLRASTRLYARYAASMLAIVVVIVALAVALTRTLQLARENAGVHLKIPLGDPGIDSFSTFVLLAPAYPLSLLLVGSPLIALLRHIDAGEPARPWAALREVLPLLPRLAGVGLLALLVLGLLEATVVGLPYAVKKGVDWTFAGQEVVFERRGLRDGLAASSRRVRGRWWGVAGVGLALFFIGAVVGPLAGALLIALTGIPLWTINFVGLAFFALTLPFMVNAVTLMYLDPRRAGAAPGADPVPMGSAQHTAAPS